MTFFFCQTTDKKIIVNRNVDACISTSYLIYRQLTKQLENCVNVIEIVIFHMSAHCFDIHGQNAFEWIIFFWNIVRNIDLWFSGWFHWTSVHKRISQWLHLIRISFVVISRANWIQLFYGKSRKKWTHFVKNRKLFIFFFIHFRFLRVLALKRIIWTDLHQMLRILDWSVNLARVSNWNGTMRSKMKTKSHTKNRSLHI